MSLIRCEKRWNMFSRQRPNLSGDCYISFLPRVLEERYNAGMNPNPLGKFNYSILRF